MSITGDKELIAALQMLGRGVPNSIVDKAMTSASKPMLTDAVDRARTHRQSGKRPKGGHLDEGIVFRRKAQQSRGKRSYVMGAMNRARALLHLVEFGTRPHFQPHRFGGIMHPGARPFPIMRPAFDDHADDIPKTFGQEIVAAIEDLARSTKK